MESMILATKSGTPIIGQIAVVMGWIMNAIYKVLDAVGIQNIGLCIIIFSILIYLCMTPLQIKQQKFSKLSAIMQPEIQKIQKKYQGKKDQDSMMKMQEETQAVYQKYGVSATGSCVQLAIQMPILFALYQVIQNIPAYVGSVYNVFNGVCTKILAVDGFTDIINKFINIFFFCIFRKQKTNCKFIIYNSTGQNLSRKFTVFSQSGHCLITPRRYPWGRQGRSLRQRHTCTA